MKHFASALLERGDLVTKGALESWSCLATRLILLEPRFGRHELRVAQDPEHGRHHQVAGGEAVLQIFAVAERNGELRLGVLSRASDLIGK
jgi:hypothetical protein